MIGLWLCLSRVTDMLKPLTRLQGFPCFQPCCHSVLPRALIITVSQRDSLLTCWDAQAEVLEQLAEKYLASIPAQDFPSKRSPNQLTPIEFCFPEHVVQEDVRQAKPAPWPGFKIHAHRFHDPHVKHQIHGSHVTRSMCPV